MCQHQKTIIVYCVVIAVLILQSEASGLCSSDNNCTAVNTVCRAGVCSCSQGYTTLNGKCSQVLGRTCLDSLDCDDGRTVCVDSQCKCQSNIWREENGICISYYESACKSWSECGYTDRFDCIDNKCVCAKGYKSTNDTGCVKVLDSSCEPRNNDSDCPLDNASCKTYYWSYDYGRCKCNAGFAEKNDVCIQVLGSSCDDVVCGNPMSYYYKYLTGEYMAGDLTIINYYEVYSRHLACNLNNVCTCDHGFIASNESSCFRVLGKYCTEQSECGNYPGYFCNLNSSTCQCSENFYEHTEEWYYDEDRSNNDDFLYYYWSGGYNPVTLCLPVIGRSCSSQSCDAPFSTCNETGICDCVDGFTATNMGVCEQVLGMACSRDILCEKVEGGTCGSENTCVCKEGYFQEDAFCIEVLGFDCFTDNDCQLDNSVCIDGTCQCASGLKQFENKCLRDECAQNVPILPDIHRRSVHYRSERDEPVIDDALLHEGWYSIGKHTILVSPTSPDPGQCSTFHPIYLTDSLSSSQKAIMESNEISLSAVVGGLDAYGRTENVQIKIRKCGQDTQIKIQSINTHFTGFCLDNTGVTKVRRSGGMHASVFPDLLFEITDDGNVTKYTPYVVFSCLPTEHILNTEYIYNRYPYRELDSDDDINFYYVYWYIDDIHFKSYGPVGRNGFFNRTSLSEHDILDAGYKLGFKIRCLLEIFDTPNGHTSVLATSKDLVTGVKSSLITIDEDSGNYLHKLDTDTPIGCESFEGDKSLFCNIKWPVSNVGDNQACETSVTGQNMPKECSITLKGLTHYGYTNTWGSWQNIYKYGYYSQYKFNETHYVYLYESFLGAQVNVTDTSTVKDLKIKFSSASELTGHRLWEGYKMPDINGHVITSTTVTTMCNISMSNAPVISVDTWSQLSDNVVMDSVGEFILYRSRTKPVEIHVETEKCTSSLLGDICMCGVTYRDGNAIYTVNYCGGLARIGQVYGVKKNRDNNNVALLNGMALDVYIKNGRITGLGLSSNHSKETLEAGEGLCAFSGGSYKHRNGAETYTNEGYLTSWHVPSEENLLNPVNHKSFTWSEEYMMCYCPADAKDREIYYTSSWTDSWNSMNHYYEYANLYSGNFRCSSGQVCKMNHTGEEWLSSLLPAFALDSVTARMEIRYEGIWPLLHLFCDFETQTELRYKITWKLDGEIIYQSVMMTAADAGRFYINNNNFVSEKFLLDAGFSCGVSVHDNTDRKLLDALYSDEIRAIEFVETEILMPRGGDITVQLKLNIPLVCKKKSKCHFDFKLFDPNDSYNCSDSTVAFKNKHTCGQRVFGTDTDSALVAHASILNLTLTTKNNDKYMLRDTFTLKMKLVASGETSRFWEQTFKKKLTIFVRDDEVYWQGNYCYANNDPRMRTFDGQYYSNILVGEFVMMKHKKLPVEIQMETHYWGWYSCGVTVRAGRDVFTINHCHGEHITGYLLADDRILKVKERSEHRYEIYLPHGTRIDVRVSSWWLYMVNVFIYPSPADMKQVEGLCGDFDGNLYGDLIHSDGSVTYASYYYWWWWWIYDANDFIRSWGAGSENARFQSLTDIETLEKTLESWYTDDVLCVCTGNNGDGEVKCSANERETCLSPKPTDGVEVSISKRHKRSGQVLDKEYKRRMAKLREKRAAYGNIAERTISRRSVDTVDVNATVASCRERLTSSCSVMSVQDNGLNVTFEELVNNCGQDKATDPDTDWTALTCEAIEANVENEIKRDVQFQANNPDVAADILENLCVGNCTGNGNCVNGSCVCLPGFTASDCSLDLSREVAIEGITGDGICDIHSYDCDCIRLTTSGSLATTKYYLVHREYDQTGSWKEIRTIFGTVVYDNFNEVFVCPEISHRRKRSTTGNNPIANQYTISLSNDGTTFSNGSTVFVLDSTCLKVNQTNGTNTIVLMPGFCIIGGVCYATETTSSSDPCLVCNVTASLFDWTRNETASCDKQQTDESTTIEPYIMTIEPYIIGIIAGVAGVLVVGVVLAAICIVKKKLALRVAVYDGELYGEPSNKRFRTVQLRKDGWVDESL